MSARIGRVQSADGFGCRVIDGEFTQGYSVTASIDGARAGRLRSDPGRLRHRDFRGRTPAEGGVSVLGDAKTVADESEMSGVRLPEGSDPAR